MPHESKLLSSFFFSRMDARRSDGNRLVPTFAYQLALKIPEAGSVIIGRISDDISILQSTMAVQMTDLVLATLRRLETGAKKSQVSHIPYLVVIDGLDECSDSSMQSQIIKVISDTLTSEKPFDLRFLITSRPESSIADIFYSRSVHEMTAHIVLDNHYNPDKDIHTYLQSEFSTLKREHALGPLLSDEAWPSPEDIDTLVGSSSGQFIYAATVMRYIKNHHRDPREGLSVIINNETGRETSETLTDSPYTELDAMYHHVLSTAVARMESYDSIMPTFQVLLFTFSKDIHSTNDISAFLAMEQNQVRRLLADLHSIIFIPISSDAISESQNIIFLHAPFSKYLKDSSRSRQFHIAEDKAHAHLGHYCFARILEYQSDLGSPALSYHVWDYSRQFYFLHIKRSKFDDTLLNELRNNPLVSQHILSSMFKFNFYEGDSVNCVLL
ncbi:hypothetical protein BDQ17DRAFT_146391 [Cyathus striatus]|nr:hypothetical protein BDQ17DRAFT_146391 [Cyathus striatus]